MKAILAISCFFTNFIRIYLCFLLLAWLLLGTDSKQKSDNTQVSPSPNRIPGSGRIPASGGIPASGRIPASGGILGSGGIPATGPAARYRWLWAAAVMAVVSTLLSLAPLTQFYRIGGEILLLAGAVFLHHRDALRMGLFLIFFYEIGAALWDFLSGAALAVFTHNPQFMETGSLPGSLAVWLARLMMTGLAIGLYIHERQVDEQERPRGTATKLAGAMGVLGLFGIITLSQQQSVTIDDDLLTTWTILGLILVMSIQLFHQQRQYAMEKQIADLKDAQARLLERDYQVLNDTYMANARLYHDLHNHMDTLHHYLSEGDAAKALQYVDTLRSPILELGRQRHTGNGAVDYLLNLKLAAARAAHITTRFNIELPQNTGIHSADLTAILGNLLDNGLEAAGNAPEDMRFINLTIRRINQMVIIKVENGYGPEPDQALKTTKTDHAVHGFGLKSVQAAAQKYDGTVETAHGGHLFTAVVTLNF